MAVDKDPPVPVTNNNKRRTSDLLPRFYRTDANKKFLNSTLDQLTSPGTVKKISGYIGRQYAKSVKTEDIFLAATDKLRQDYQLEPALVYQDEFENVKFFKDYIDHINQISVLNGITTNHERINKQEFYSWNPNIDWDKFVNFQQYYWLPNGPDPITISGQQLAIDSTYTVQLEDQGDNYAYLFTPDGLTRNPTLILFRGQTYRFSITSPNNPFSIKNLRTEGPLDLYTNDSNIVSDSSVESGDIVFNVPFDAPDELYYLSEKDANAGGIILIKDIEENTFLDVEKDIVGKKTYKLPNGLSLSNGMKLDFIGNTSPEFYKNSFWIVEGVGEAIKLIDIKQLDILSTFTEEQALLFDNDPFDKVPFSSITNYPKSKDYLVINRCSKDKNAWSRTNRWFHQDVIKATAEYRGSNLELDQFARAIRPIIEFNADLKLYNFGHCAKANVDVIDNTTTDVFSTIVGTLGYNIDGIDLVDGMRVLFTADPDRLVNGRIFRVEFVEITVPGRMINFNANAPSDSTGSVNIITDTIKCELDHGLINGDRVIYLSNNNIQLQGLTHRQIYFVKVIDPKTLQLYTDSFLSNVVDIYATGDGIHSLEVFSGFRRQINLIETEDSIPQLNETVLINQGIVDEIKLNDDKIINGNQGLMYWYNGKSWLLGQTKTDINQAPLFDIFDSLGNSYSDATVYDGTNFKGTPLFSYKQGTGSSDSELGFALSYRNINNVGDIVFSFNLLEDSFYYKDVTKIYSKSLDVGYLKKIITLTDSTYENGWVKNELANVQPIIRIFKEHNIDGVIKGFPIDVFDDHADISDLKVKVYVNGNNYRDFTVKQGTVRKEVFFSKAVTSTDVVYFKFYSKQPKNENGHYEFPINFQYNPLNYNLTQFTLGEVIDHVSSIVDNLSSFTGLFPGYSNLRDLGYVSHFGTRFVQHSGPLNLSLYSLGSKEFNVMSSLSKAKNEYGKFKTAFLVKSSEIAMQAEPKQLTDRILQELNKDKPKTDPYYLSDMFAYTANKKFEYRVLDYRTKIYPLNKVFSLDVLSNKSVLIYKNNTQLLHGKDYVFNSDYFEILTELVDDDLLEVYEYETTDGSFCPPTPTKLGLYPLYQPKKYIDDTYLTPTLVVQGHDGSITIGFNDYRDDVLLELESRIYNNIKIKYDSKLFDIYDYIPGKDRNLTYSKKEHDEILSKYFFEWSSNVQNDYSQVASYDPANYFTFNYRGASLVDDTDVSAFWRGIYKWVLDTDRPHTHPWECLGFSIEPSWWQETYGPAPYTSDNFVLWDDIKDGIIREPGKTLQYNKKFAKSILAYGKPVNSIGKLVDPVTSLFVKNISLLSEGGYYVFGDCGPVETAWRRSSYCPFSLLQAAILMNPCKVIALTFDRSRVKRNVVGQLIYSDTDVRIRLDKLILPSTINDNVRNYTSGLVNYVVDNLSVELPIYIAKYKNELLNLKNKISTRLGGFTSKEKLKIILDSKSPSSTMGIFVPDENYKIFLNTSSPVKKVDYSGVIITKFADGYDIRGYNKESPYFKYYTWDSPGRGVNVGGISESYIEWEIDSRYVSGQIVKYNNGYYRVNISHTTESYFDKTYYTKLSSLPVVGGRDILIRNSFDKRLELVLSYGTKLRTIQEVVDFILGYGEYLSDQGFLFDDYNVNLKAVENWETSAKEFAFWTTQNWSAGSALSLSPSAINLNLASNYSVVDNLLDDFYGYKIFRVDGELLSSNLTNSYRQDNSFSLSPKNTNHGIYGATLRLVQKEHVLLLDNITLFNDIIYDIEPGYKHDRVKMIGYLSSNWNGGFDIPGFIYDRAVVESWEPWTDYNLGDIVFHKDFYYSAKKFIPGTDNLKEEDWNILDSKPESRMLPNWDYKAEQFTDFYDLDSDNFDSEQQRLGQHLIGYQKRQYLENIINDDISQYKFYQGMISEKGTQNVLNKLFDVLSADDQESLTFNEEWAIRVGSYGASDIYNEVEFNLDEQKIQINPQPILLTENIGYDPDFIYRIKQSDIVIKPVDYSHNIWPTSNVKDLLRSAGYVRYTDVLKNFDTLEEVLNEDISNYREGDYVWTAFLAPPKNWSVYRLTKHSFRIEVIEYSSGTLTITVDTIPNVSVGDILGLSNLELVKGFYKIADVIGRKIYITKKLPGGDILVTGDSSSCVPFYFTESRVDLIDNLNENIPKRIKDSELIWVDNNGSNNQVILEHTKIYKNVYIEHLNIVESNLQFGRSIAVSKEGTIAAVGDKKQVTIFFKNIEDSVWKQQFTIVSSYSDSKDFGFYLSLSPDGNWLGISETKLDNSRYVHFYSRNSKLGTFNYRQTITGISVTASDLGSGISIAKELDQYIAIIAAANNNKAFVYTISLSDTDNWILQQTLVESGTVSFGYDVSLSDDSSKIAISDPGTDKVYVYERTSNGYSNFQTVNDITLSLDRFGQSIALSGNGKYLAVGASLDDSTLADSGRVDVYILNEQYELQQKIKSHRPESFEYFGYEIQFMNDDKTLVILSLNGDVDNFVTFDNGTTTFDNHTSRFNDVHINAGRIDIYDRYNINFVFGQSLTTNEATDLADNYGYAIGVGANSVLVGAPNETQDTLSKAGRVFSYYKFPESFNWSIKYEQADRVIVDNFKKSYLYDSVEQKLISYIDILDVTQGKIAGPADQEIRFKTFYDPATYNIGTDDVNVDDGQTWNKKQVGLLWWDLNKAKFLDATVGNETYRAANWNKLYATASIDIYEWVETKFKPSEWDTMSGTEKGEALGISGTSKYGNLCYSVRQYYDRISQSFKNIYYYWVKNPTIIPNTQDRSLSANDVSKLISDPVAQGYPCLSFTSPSSFILINLANYIKSTSTNLNIEYWTVDKQYRTTNKHSQWKLISSHEKTIIPTQIEQKWFDSLIGKDSYGRLVPSNFLPIKKKYGVLFRPRQSMFVNRIEALKQFIERTNKVLKSRIITDDYDISRLLERDPIPNIFSGLYDVVVDTVDEFRFVNTSLVETAGFTPVIKDGKITDVNIINPGYGYKTRAYLTVSGTGKGAVLRTVINDLGQVIDVEIVNKGYGYTDSTTLNIRNFSVLVNTDTTILGIWSIYEYVKQTNSFYKVQSEGYNVSNFWNYIDWYDVGYSQFTKIDHLVENTNRLYSLKSNIGDVVKVETIGTGGWLLLEKYSSKTTIDYTQNYKVIGRQNGTIELSSGLYDYSANIIGYDTQLFDSQFYDYFPAKELEIILNVLKNNILVDDLYSEYLNLFFSSLRYVMYEQPFVDWVYKTSFVKSKHNLGELKQKVTYKNDSLENFEDYIKEVKPYRTKIREYVSSYTKIENTNSMVTDFDLPTFIDSNFISKTVNINIQDDSTFSSVLSQYPWKNWKENVGFKLKSIEIVDGGSGYISNPVVKIIGSSKRTAKANAFISAGKVNRIQITDYGSGYLSAPKIILDGGLSVTGVQAKSVAVIESEVVKSTLVAIKFDRLSKTSLTGSDLAITETFIGTGSQLQFQLKYAPQTQRDTYNVTVNGLDILKDDFIVTVKKSLSRGFTSYYGILTLETAPSRGDIIVITYQIGFEHLNALDRIKHFYDPSLYMLGKDYAQLMTGIDYGGVNIQGLVNFTGVKGFDSDLFGETGWGADNNEFEDQIFVIPNDSTYGEFEFDYIPASGQHINVYLKRAIPGSINEYTEIRLDDINFGTSTAVINPNAVMSTIIGNGVTNKYELPNPTSNPPLELVADDIIIFRKNTSDGSIKPNSEDYDTQLEGGNLSYTTALGISPEDVVVDGDGLITPNTSYAPEEVVPGQVVDAVAIKVFQSSVSSSANIFQKTFISDGTRLDFQLDQLPQNTSAVFVKVGNLMKRLNVDYSFNWQTRSVHFYIAPANNQIVTIIGMGYTAAKILDLNYFVSDGSTLEFVTNAPFNNETLGHIVLVDGVSVNYEIFETDSSYTDIYKVGIRFGVAQPIDSVITYLITTDENYSASIVRSDQLAIDGSTVQYPLISPVGIKDPLANNILVIKNGEILNPGISECFVLSDNDLTYTMTKYKQAPGTVNATLIKVYLDGEELNLGLDYTINLAGFSITLNSLKYVEGSILTVMNTQTSQYTIESSGSSNSIIFASAPALGSVVDIVSFYNHDILDIVRTQELISTTAALDIDTVDYYSYSSLKGGKFKLFRKVNSDDFVWIIKNNKMLTSGVDFYLDASLEQIILCSPITSIDVLDVIIFGSKNSSSGFAYMQFKDMLNRFHYKRLNKAKTTRLSQDLMQFDAEIYVADGAVLDPPDVPLNRPGIIEINGERIEYFQKNGNILTKLRRGTLGTGSPIKHKSNTLVVNLGPSETIGYQDTQDITRIITTGQTDQVSLTYAPGINNVEVFVGGLRLRKSSLNIFNPDLEFPYSPEGDVVNSAEFTVDQSSKTVNLTNSVPAEREILVVKRQGQIWQDDATTDLIDSNTSQAKFILAAEPFYPEFSKS